MVLPWTRIRQNMACPFNVYICLICFFMGANLLSGCVSYRFLKATAGREVLPLSEACLVGKTTLKEALEILGAPDKVAEVKGKDVLIYQRSVVANSGLSFGIPLSELLGLDFSGTGSLARYDVLLLFFTPDGILSDMAGEKGSEHPFLKTILYDQKRD